MHSADGCPDVRVVLTHPGDQRPRRPAGTTVVEIDPMGQVELLRADRTQ
ncbi:hypothetical protein [Pseudonocardia sp. NPDC046786]